jgi:predicted XRE-type DNA-binding protein
MMPEEVTPTDFTYSSGNIFADLALDDADELLACAKLGYAVRKILERRQLQPDEIASLLEIHPSQVSQLMTGQYHLFSETRLFRFLNKLEQKVVIHITSHHLGQPLVDVVLES